jgi:hypothetical protein
MSPPEYILDARYETLLMALRYQVGRLRIILPDSTTFLASTRRGDDIAAQRAV